MPVDPGNLMMLGRLGATTVIGVPSCARSPKVNGFDWVLERVLAGVPVGRDDVMGMGAGGLLKEIPSRPAPRGRPEDASVVKAPSIAALILAAGQSRRMGEANKLLAEISGQPMVRRVAETVLQSRAPRLSRSPAMSRIRCAGAWTGWNFHSPRTRTSRTG